MKIPMVPRALAVGSKFPEGGASNTGSPCLGPARVRKDTSSNSVFTEEDSYVVGGVCQFKIKLQCHSTSFQNHILIKLILIKNVVAIMPAGTASRPRADATLSCNFFLSRTVGSHSETDPSNHLLSLMSTSTKQPAFPYAPTSKSLAGKGEWNVRDIVYSIPTTNQVISGKRLPNIPNQQGEIASPCLLPVS
jgi:hypothetical protein